MTFSTGSSMEQTLKSSSDLSQSDHSTGTDTKYKMQVKNIFPLDDQKCGHIGWDEP